MNQSLNPLSLAINRCKLTVVSRVVEARVIRILKSHFLQRKLTDIIWYTKILARCEKRKLLSASHILALRRIDHKHQLHTFPTLSIPINLCTLWLATQFILFSG